MGLDTLLSLGVLGALVYYCLWEDTIKPLLRGATGRRSVKNYPVLPRPRQRSRVRNAANAANAGSSHQDAKQGGANVPANVPRSPAIAVAGDDSSTPAGAIVLTPKELTQLTEAIRLRAGGATIQEAIQGGFGASKGSSPAYKRAKQLFDAATGAPGG